MARRLREVDPAVSVGVHRRKVGASADDGLPALLSAADLVVAATDDNTAQLRISSVAYWCAVPAVFVGLYRGAAGGEVILSVPGGPCWRCSTAGMRGSLGEVDTPTNYGTGRLDAEPGLLADIQHVSSAALKLALGLLDDDESSAVSRLVAGPLARGDAAPGPSEW